MVSEYALIQRKLHQLEAQIDDFLPIHQEHPSFDINHHVIVYRIKHQIDFIKNLITREIESHQNSYDHDDHLQDMVRMLSLLENKFKECLIDECTDQEQEEREEEEEGGGASCLCDLSCIDDEQFEMEKETKQEQQDHEDAADSLLVDNEEEVEGDLGMKKEMVMGELREVVLTKEKSEHVVAETMRRKERKRGRGWFMGVGVGVGVVTAMAGLAGLAIANLGLENESVYLVPT